LEGSTACFVCATHENDHYKLTVGNVGDSRAMLLSRKSFTPYLALTKDHKPANKKEKDRIKKAGGTVVENRLLGALSVSRAFGDFLFKIPKTNPPQAQMLTSLPDFSVLTVTSQDVLFMGCDGVFENEIFTTKSLGNFIDGCLDQTDDLAQICGHVLDNCLSRGSFDNMTAILIQFKDGRDYHRDGFQFIPGKYFTGSDMGYQKAYAADAARAGFTLKEAVNLYTENQAYNMLRRYQKKLKKKKNVNKMKTRENPKNYQK